MSKSLQYLKDGEDFGAGHFPGDFGFSGSNAAVPGRPAMPSGSHPHGHAVHHVDRHDDGSYTVHHAHGGFTHCHADGGMTHHDAKGHEVQTAMGAAAPGRFDPHNNHMHDESEAAHRFAKGGDVAQDKAMIAKAVHQHEEHDHKGEAETDLHLARGGRSPRLPRGMRPKASHVHVIGEEMPVNRPPRNPMRSTTPANAMPGGEMGYGVQPSDEAGVGPGGMAMRRGGMHHK